MSRTDKTRPTAVKAMDRPSYLVPWHDHRFGPCDLPASPAVPLRRTRGAGTRCCWETSTEFRHSPAAGCGCSKCTQSFARRAERRRDRQAARRTLRRWADDC